MAATTGAGYAWEGTINLGTSNGFSTMGRMGERHLETINLLYCDGHVKAQKLEAIRDTTTVATTGGNKSPVYTFFTIAQ
jgi:prepilin-type processing-associated H-X9-DG protein